MKILWCRVSISSSTFFEKVFDIKSASWGAQAGAQLVNAHIDAFVSVAAAIHAAVTCGSEGLLLPSARGPGNRHDSGKTAIQF